MKISPPDFGLSLRYMQSQAYLTRQYTEFIFFDVLIAGCACPYNHQKLHGMWVFSVLLNEWYPECKHENNVLLCLWPIRVPTKSNVWIKSYATRVGCCALTDLCLSRSSLCSKYGFTLCSCWQWFMFARTEILPWLASGVLGRSKSQIQPLSSSVPSAYLL